MSSGKYNRHITFNCPVCGSDMFEYKSGVDGAVELLKCRSCGRETTRDELTDDNSENISEHVKEIGDEAVKDAVKSLRKAFKGKKGFRVR